MTEITILNLLSNRPMYGAEMIEEIKRLSGNTVIMSLPTLYSSLHRMADKKLVNSYQKESAIGGRCRVYNITNTGRDFLAKNPIKIDYQQIADNSVKAQKTFASLEEAFSLPLNKKPLIPTELPDDKRILQINSNPTVNTTTVTTPQQKKEDKLSPYTPYIAPNEKITATPAPQYQQTTIGLSGTTGGNDLRPLLKLNSIPVGNNYVLINRLRIISVVIATLFFTLVNFIFSLTHNVCQEFYTIVYIALALYLIIWTAIYIFYPRIKAVFSLKMAGIRQSVFTLILIALVIVSSFATSTPSVMWLLFFAPFPIVRYILMAILHKRSWFVC